MATETQSKGCSRCGGQKPLSDFHRQPSGERGRHSWCRDCFNAYARETRKRDYSAEQKRRWLLASRYGLTPVEFAAILAAQDGCCAICRAALTKPHIDHDHATGAVRGILCHGCNIKLPAIEDESYRSAAIAYLERSR